MRTLAAVLALLVLGSAGAFAEDLAALVAKFRSEEHDDRYAAYTSLNQSKDPAVVPLLVKTLPECPEMGQYYGVLVLQRHPPELTKPALRTLTKSSSVHLRVIAAAALQRMGDRRAAAVIVKGLGDPAIDDTLRATLLTRIYSVRDPAVQAAVRGLLRPDTDATVLQNAIYNIYLVRDKQAAPGLRVLLAAESASARGMAAACLLLLGDASATDALVQALGDGIDVSPLYKVKNFLDQSRPVPVAVLEAVHARLEHETSTSALRSLVEILGEHGHAKAAADIRPLLEHRDSLVSKAAFEALSRLPGGLAPETMRKLLEKGDDARRLAAADALRRADDTSGFDVVVEVLRSGARLQDRYEAARLLSGFRTARSVPPLLAALDDENITVRANAFNSLGTVLRALFPYRRLDLGSTGYVTSGTQAARAQGAKRIRAWWESHKQSDW